MKILIVNKFLYPNGGSETYIFELGKELIRQGHEVQYFGMEHEARIVGNNLNEYTSNMDFHSSKLSKFLYPFKIIYSIEAYKKISYVLNDFKPDVVHINNFNFQLTPSIIIAVRDWEKNNKCKIKILYTAHDYQWVCPNHMLQIPSTGELCFKCAGGKYGECAKQKCIHNSFVKSLLGTIEAKYYYYKKTYQLVDRIICPSAFLKEKIDTYNGLSKKTIVMHNFIDSKKIAREVIKEDYILYFGRYSKEKGVDTLLKVCMELADVNKDIKFKFAGVGPLNVKVENCMNVENVGFLQGDNLVDCISKAKIVVMPSEWYENCPFAIMEAQIYGTPLIASDIGGISELMINDYTGELFEAGNSVELKNKILSLYYDEDKLAKYHDNCKNVTFDSAEEYVDKLIMLINSI